MIESKAMLNGNRIGGILLMGGEGRRFGSPIPKQFHLLAGTRVYLYALETFLAANFFDEILLVCHPDWREEIQERALPPIARVILGGGTRQQSSYLGLKGFLEKPDIVLIHDAVRPFVTESILRENVERAIVCGAVDTCIPSADTLVQAPQAHVGHRLISNIPNREEYLRGQTPQTFRMEWIIRAHEQAIAEGIENASDDCRLVLQAGMPIQVVKGSEENLKITSELDLFIAEQLIFSRGRDMLKPPLFK